MSRQPPLVAVKSNGRGHRRRRRLAASCLAALILKPGDSSTVAAAAFVLSGGASCSVGSINSGGSGGSGGGGSTPTCFVSAARAGRLRPRPTGGQGLGLVRAVTAAARSDVGSRGSSSIGPRASHLAAWGGSGGGGGSLSGEVNPPTTTRGEAAAATAAAAGGGSAGATAATAAASAPGKGFGYEQSTRSRLFMSTAALGTSGGGAVRAAAAGATAVASAAAPGESRGGEGQEAASPENLTKLKVSELKALYRQGGGKPGALRKAELVERLTRSLDEGRGSAGPRPSEATASPPPPVAVEANAARTPLGAEVVTPPAVDADASSLPVSSSQEDLEDSEGLVGLGGPEGREGPESFFMDSDLLAPHTVDGVGVGSRVGSGVGAEVEVEAEAGAEATGVVVGKIDNFTPLVTHREEEERLPATSFGADGGGDGGGGGDSVAVVDPSESVALASSDRRATEPDVAFSQSVSSDAHGAGAQAGAGAGAVAGAVAAEAGAAAAAAGGAAEGLAADASTFGGREEGSVAGYRGEAEEVKAYAGDVLSSGPSAVVAAARARGAAAAAASARVAASGRSRAMTEVRRHTDAVRSKAANGWSQSPEGLEQEKQRQEGGMWPTKGSAALAGIPLQGNGERNGVGVGAGVGTGVEVGMGAGARGGMGLGAGAGAAAQVKGGGRSSAIPIPGYGDVPRQPAHMMMGSAPRGHRASGQGDRGGRETDHQGGGGKAGRADGTGSGARRDVGRPRLMPAMPNPWSRGGAGGAAEGLPEEGDVVDAFLEDVMMLSSTSDGKDREPSGDTLFDREARFESRLGASMQLNFLGTASCIPSTSRGVSSTVLRNEGELWMFDVGEGTQVQIQRSTIKPTRITKIFITHAHGDHSFGLPGMLCIMGRNFERTPGKRVEIYGPTGLRSYLRAALRYTNSKVTAPYVVHELADVPYLHGDVVPPPDEFHVDIEQDYRYGEQRGGRNFYPDKKGHFELFRDEKWIVRAAPMKHGMPCVGYCVEEPDRPGRLKIEHVSPILNEHKKAIMKATGRKDVGWLLGALKLMKSGDSITLPGTDCTIRSEDAVDPSVKGRKVVVLGDTCDASSMVPLAMGADVVVHEATNAWLTPLDQGKTYADVERDAISHGHSTPVMAAVFAQKVGAKTLVLNHFSARYRGDDSDASTAGMMRIEQQAMRAGGFERHQVVAAWDLLQLPVLSADQWEANQTKAREDDAAHADDLLSRACEWQEEQLAEASSTPTTADQEEQSPAPERHQGAAAQTLPPPPPEPRPDFPRMASPGDRGLLGEGGDHHRVEGGPCAVATHRSSFEGDALDGDQRVSSRLERNNAIIYGSREAAGGVEVGGGGGATGAARRAASDLITR